jgi:hypothetical protein
MSLPTYPSDTPGRRYGRWPHKLPSVTIPACALLALLEKTGPMTMTQIEALTLHKQVGCLIWPGKLAEFHREAGETYAITAAGHDYLKKLRASDFLITPA